MATGFVWHELYMWHDTGNAAGFLPPGLTVQPGDHFENPETKRRFKNLLDACGVTEKLVAIAPRAATRAELERVHTAAYLDRLESMSRNGGGDAGDLTPFGPDGFEIAKLSAGGAIALLDAVIDGRVRNGYALTRPPGHHCRPDGAMGFCMLCNGAVAARHAMAAHGLKRIAFVDWDVHHGNGTQAAFYDDPSVLTISVHQDGCYPPGESGLRHETGSGAGVGASLNIPLPPGCGTGAYQAAMERVILPALERFGPDLIVVSCGFDPGANDPLARMLLHSDSFRWMTARVMEAADRLCGGRLAMLHEGGYSAPAVPYMGLAVIEQLAGIETGVTDPFLEIFQAQGHQELKPWQEAEIEAAAALVDGVPIP
mgnify:CR=1 FL=1